MKSIDALRALEHMPSSVRWYTLFFNCYEDARAFCDACFSKEAVIVQQKALAGQTVLVVEDILRDWCEAAPLYDAVVIDPDGYKLNAVFIYMLED